MQAFYLFTRPQMYLDDGTIFPIKVVFRNFILVWEVTHPIMPFYARHYYIFYAPKVYKIFGIFDVFPKWCLPNILFGQKKIGKPVVLVVAISLK